MNILGVYGGLRSQNQDASAAIICDGKIIAAAEEERFTRIKHAPGTLPFYSIRYCLAKAGLEMNDVDKIAFPGSTWINIQERLSLFLRHKFGHCPPILLVDHHMAHAASSYYLSGFETDTLILTYDYSGDCLSTTVNLGHKNEIKRIKEYRFPNSLGVYYAIITQVLGFSFGEDEYKVMGLSSFGEDRFNFDWLLSESAEGYHLNTDFLRRDFKPGEPPLSVQEPIFNDAALKQLGSPRLPGQTIEQKHMDIACSAQRHLEKIVLNLVSKYQAQTQAENICVAGGVGLNSVLNQKLAQHEKIKAIYVPPAAGDSGLSLGAALEVCRQEGEKMPLPLKTAALGPDYSNAEIHTTLKELGVSFEEIEDPSETAAQLLGDNLIVGWFQGRMEFGPRALGQRSILGDPRQKDMKERINAAVKFREGFRPFAPSVTEESTSDFFNNTYSSPFMTATFDVKESRRDDIPAVTHVDGTARVHTVNKETSKLYHELIENFRRIAGIPVVLNTSFNVRGQAIVEHPRQAVSTFYGSGLNALVIGNFLLRK